VALDAVQAQIHLIEPFERLPSEKANVCIQAIHPLGESDVAFSDHLDVAADFLQEHLESLSLLVLHVQDIRADEAVRSSAS
jgi:hypothetical protein